MIRNCDAETNAGQQWWNITCNVAIEKQMYNVFQSFSRLNNEEEEKKSIQKIKILDYLNK